MSDPNLKDFIGLSAVLIGIAADRLAPAIDPINLPPLFFDTARKGMGTEAFSNLLELYASIKSQPPEKIADTVLGSSDLKIVQGARSIMKLWLLGSWYQPDNKDNVQVVSDQAYKESWAWKIAQSHPMGYSQYHFGYWAEQPPTLKQFTGVDAKEGKQP